MPSRLGSRAKCHRVDRYLDPDPVWPDFAILLELDGLGLPGHTDERLFFSWAKSAIDDTVDAEEVLAPLRTQLATIEEEAGGDGRQLNRLRSEFSVAYRGLIRDSWLAAASDMPEWPIARDDFEAVLGACVGSRYFRIGFELEWVAPPLDQLSRKVREALERLRSLDGEAAALGRLFGEDAERFDVLSGDPQPSDLCDVVRFDFSTGDYGELYARIEDFVGDHLRREQRGEDRGSIAGLSPFATAELLTGDAWLERKGKWVQINPAVEDLCMRLGRRATDSAPPLASREYEIRVVAHPPDQWRRVGHQVTIRLAPVGTDEDFDLSVVSTGIATWAA